MIQTPNPTENEANNNNSLKRTHSELTGNDEPPPPPAVNGIDDKENNGGLNPKIEEPPAKRMKIPSPQIPHYNSHNIYHRPPAPSSSIPIPSLPAIVDPVLPSMLFADDDDANNNNDDPYGSVAPLAGGTEEWPLCAFCNKGGDLSRCSSCRQSYYCNRECQVAHWEVHSIICLPGPPQPPPQPPAGQPVQPPIIHHPPPPPQYNNNYNEFGNGSMPHSNGYNMNEPHQPQQFMPSRPRPAPRRSSYQSSTNDGITKEQYYCEECDRYFKNGQALGGHRSRVHSTRRGNNNADGLHPTKRKRSRQSRARYDATGNGQYVCPHCGREFSSGNALGGHISGAHTKKSRRNAQRNSYNQQYDNSGYGQRPPTSKYVNPIAI